ncbi:MAG: hypothetical protein ABW168_07040 [Sedimenticola sp.]
MALLTKNGFREAQPSQLSVFDVPPTQTAVQNVYYSEIRPITQLSRSGPIEFVISGQNGMEYIDLKKSQVYAKVKITHENGTDLADTSNVGPINLLLQSLFSQVDIAMQGKMITSTTGHYPYKAYIQTLMKYGYDAKSSQLTSQLWHKDVATKMDDTDAAQGLNRGLHIRSKYFKLSKSAEMIGPIYHDLCKLDRYILNQIGITLKFYRSRPEFLLMTNDDSPKYAVHIEDIVLKICKVQLNPAVIYGHSEIMKSNVNAKYPFTKTEVKMFALAKGQVNVTLDNMFQGVRPNKVVVGFVSSQAVTGSYSLNPFNFQSYDINQIVLSVDGIPVSGNPLKVNFDDEYGSNCINVFTAMLECSGKWMNDAGNQLSRDDINGGYALFAYQLEPLFDEGGYLTLIKQGNVRLDAQFSKSLPEPVTCVIYSEYPGYFEINQSREIVIE